MKLFKKCLSYVLLGGFVAAAVLMPIRAASADTSVDWMNPNATVETTRDPDASAECDYEYVTHTVEYPWLNRGQPTLTEKACISKGKDLDVARSLYGEQYVRFHSDSVYRLLYAESTVRIEKDSNFASYIRNTSDFRLVTVADLSVSLSVEKTNDLGEVVAYRVRSDSSTLQLPVAGEDGVYNHVYSYRISSDRQYLAAYVNYTGVVKVDLRTGEVTKIALFLGSANYRRDAPTVEAISDDGRYVFMGRTSSVIDTDGCGELLVGQFNDERLSNECPTQGFSSLVSQQVPFTYLYSDVHFIDDGYGIEYLATLDGNAPAGVDVAPIHVTIHAEGYDQNTTSHLTYLALGDSYSSGEGDNGILFGKKYYRTGTDDDGVTREKCHISTRSYPYLLAGLNKLPTDSWNTVACSGALVDKDYSGDDSEYLGQGNRLESVKDKLAVYKKDALKDFTPGRVKQIEFVKKYKPKIITLTGTGNDANFSDILKACVTPPSPFGSVEDTCSYAGDSHGITLLGMGISRQYSNARNLIRALKEASPTTRVYYVGYPQFLKDTNKPCGLWVSLSMRERKVFREGVTYLNNVLRAAVESEGAEFIDIENTLKDHLLCGEDAYVTGYNLNCVDGGLSFLKGFSGKDECQESFHPTPKGHALIANDIFTTHPHIIEGTSCGAPQVCKSEVALSEVEVPQVFEDAYRDDGDVNSVYIKGGTELAAQKNNPDGNILASIDSLRPNEVAHAYITSDPVELGNFTVDSMGKLIIDKAVPASVPAGYHTLHVETKSRSGDPIELWWIIRIFGSEGDVDEDGVWDTVDPCYFMSALGKDEDSDGIDDGCDSLVNRGTSSSISDKSVQAETPLAQVAPAITSPGSIYSSYAVSHTEDQKGLLEIEQESSKKAGVGAGNGQKPSKYLVLTIGATAILSIMGLIILVLILRVYYEKRKESKAA